MTKNREPGLVNNVIVLFLCAIIIILLFALFKPLMEKSNYEKEFKEVPKIRGPRRSFQTSNRIGNSLVLVLPNIIYINNL